MIFNLVHAMSFFLIFYRCLWLLEDVGTDSRPTRPYRGRWKFGDSSLLFYSGHG